MQPLQWTVSQITAREHYAVARALQRRGELATLYTEAWCRWGSRFLRRGPQALRGLAGRFEPELPSRKVVSFTPSTLLDQARRRLRGRSTTIEATFTEFVEIGRDYARRVTRHLARQPLDPQRDAYFGYDTGCLETLELLNQRAVLSVVDQIDPARVEEQMVFEESQRWPGWQKNPGRIPEFYWQRLAAEWHMASLVLVNSNWSKTALIQQGVDEGKIIVVPLAYEPHGPPPAPLNEPPRERPLTVLWIGGVILRKGIQYLIEAAKLLRGQNVRFVIAGNLGISDQALATAPDTMSFIGKVARDQLSTVYRQADLFVLPTLSDGFAITQLEAMSYGLPVVTTPNCGEVVTHGQDGLIVPPRDAAALAQAIAHLEARRDLLPEMSRRAILKSREFSLARFAQTLVDGAENFRMARAS